jgi:hypothetical protein
MKSNFILSALLFSIFFLSGSTATFAQDQVVKDPQTQDITTPKPATKDIITEKEINKDIAKKDTVNNDIITKTEVTNKDSNLVAKDIVVGKTANGETIYQDIKGRKYTLSAAGKKVYIKKGAK